MLTCGSGPVIACLVCRGALNQGSVEEAHLQSYLDEFVFRFSRRRSRSRGLVFCRLLELAAGRDPVRYATSSASGNGAGIRMLSFALTAGPAAQQFPHGRRWPRCARVTDRSERR